MQFTGAYLSFLIFKNCIWLHQVLVAAHGLLLQHVGVSLVVDCREFRLSCRLSCPTAYAIWVPVGMCAQSLQSCVSLCDPMAHQSPLSLGFSRQECWNGWPFPPPRDLPNPGMNPCLLHCRQILYFWATREALNSLIRDQSHVLCIRRPRLNHWTSLKHTFFCLIYPNSDKSDESLQLVVVFVYVLFSVR